MADMAYPILWWDVPGHAPLGRVPANEIRGCPNEHPLSPIISTYLFTSSQTGYIAADCFRFSPQSDKFPD